METRDFAKFVANQQEADADPEVDWTGVRDEWLNNLDSLHGRVVDFLQEYIPDSISYSFIEIELTEPDIGTYLAKRMDIKIGKRQHVSLVPVGTLLIGCRGRVDAEGAAGRAPILLVDERTRSAADLIKVTVSGQGIPPSEPAQRPAGSWVWKILTNSVQRRFVDLDKKSFFDLLMEIANA